MRRFLDQPVGRTAVIATSGATVLLWALVFVWMSGFTTQEGAMPAAVVTALPQEEPATTAPAAPPVVTPAPLFQYIEVLDGCGPYYEGTCINMRSGPGEEFPVVARLRTGIVLKVAATVLYKGRTWYEIAQDGGIKYPERITSDWYVAAEVVHEFLYDGDHLLQPGGASTTKRVVVDHSEQMLSAYDGDTLFMQTPISTGLEFTPTPRGTFTVFRMTPSRYMQGPIPEVSDQYYDLPGVPWDLYFTHEGAVIHGAYWHDHFGEPWSHGCVNLPLDKAKQLYLWADIGTKVIVQD